MKQILTFILLTLLYLPLQAQEKVYTVDNIPKVHLQNKFQYVCNPAGILSQAACDSIDRMLYNLEETTGGTQNNFSYDFRDKALRTGSESGNYQALGAVAGRKAAPAAKRARGASWKADGQAAHRAGSRQQHDGNNKSSRPFL